MASAEFHKWHRQNIDPQGSFQVDNFAKCWADAIKSVKALKPSHNSAMVPCKFHNTSGGCPQGVKNCYSSRPCLIEAAQHQ